MHHDLTHQSAGRRSRLANSRDHEINISQNIRNIYWTNLDIRNLSIDHSRAKGRGWSNDQFLIYRILWICKPEKNMTKNTVWILCVVDWWRFCFCLEVEKILMFMQLGKKMCIAFFVIIYKCINYLLYPTKQSSYHIVSQESNYVFPFHE